MKLLRTQNTVLVNGFRIALCLLFFATTGAISTVEYCGSTGGWVDAVSPGDPYTLVAEGIHVSILDTNPTDSPQVLGRIFIGHHVTDVISASGLAFIVGVFDRVFIYDISTPETPKLLSTIPRHSSSVFHLFLSGSRLYALGSSLDIYDVSDVENPEYIGGFETEGDCIFVKDTQVFLCGETPVLLEIYDASDPMDIKFLSSLGTSGRAVDIVVVGDFAYLTNARGFQVVDVSDPSSPSLRGFVGTSSGFVAVSPSASHAFVGGYTGVRLVDIQDVDEPVEIFHYETQYNIQGISVLGNQVYFTSEKYGLEILDWSDRLTLSRSSQYAPPIGIFDIAIRGKVAYTSFWWGMNIVDFSDPTLPAAIGFIKPHGFCRGGAIDGDIAYLAEDTDGVEIFDVSNPAEPVLVGAFDTPGTAHNLDVRDGIAYVADDFFGLRIYDVSDPTAPLYLTSISSNVHDVVLSGSTAYLIREERGISLYDVSNVMAPSFINSIVTSGTAVAIALKDSLALVADTDSMLIYDVSDPFEIKLLSAVNRRCKAVGLIGNKALISFENGLNVYDISNPEEPVLDSPIVPPAFTHYVFGSDPQEIKVVDDLILLGTTGLPGQGYGELHILRLDEHPPTPTPTATPTITPTPAPTFANPGSDIDLSGTVDAHDLLILLRDWKKTSGP